MVPISTIFLSSNNPEWYETAKEGILFVYDKISTAVHWTWEAIAPHIPAIKEQTLSICLFLKQWAICCVNFICQYNASHPGEVKGALIVLAVVFVFGRLKNLFQRRPDARAANANPGNRP